MTDYRRLIDSETWAFIERTAACYPPSDTDMTIEAQRTVYDRMCARFHTPYPEGVSAEAKEMAIGRRKMELRRYRAMRYDAHALVLYLHGGGFVMGGLESHDSICAEICHRTGYEVVSVDYRLAPEHPHPAAFEDCLAAYRWALDSYDLPVVLVGDSAGGNLAAAVAHATRADRQRPIGQVLIYPVLGADTNLPSHLKHAEAPMLTVRDLHYYTKLRASGIDVTGDATFAPLSDTDFSRLPPTIVITAEFDPLSSEGEVYRDRILAAGGKAWWHEEAGLVHGYLRARHCAARARESFSRIIDCIKELGRGEWHHPEAPAASEARTVLGSATLHPID